MSTLTNEDKISIINQHKRNLDYTKYGLELSLMEEQAVPEPNEMRVKSLGDQIEELNKKIQVLDKELESLS
jgi:hypothetical protein